MTAKTHHNDGYTLTSHSHHKPSTSTNLHTQSSSIPPVSRSKVESSGNIALQTCLDYTILLSSEGNLFLSELFFLNIFREDDL